MLARAYQPMAEPAPSLYREVHPLRPVFDDSLRPVFDDSLIGVEHEDGGLAVEALDFFPSSGLGDLAGSKCEWCQSIQLARGENWHWACSGGHTSELCKALWFVRDPELSETEACWYAWRVRGLAGSLWNSKTISADEAHDLIALAGWPRGTNGIPVSQVTAKWESEGCSNWSRPTPDPIGSASSGASAGAGGAPPSGDASTDSFFAPAPATSGGTFGASLSSSWVQYGLYGLAAVAALLVIRRFTQ